MYLSTAIQRKSKGIKFKPESSEYRTGEGISVCQKLEILPEVANLE
jgi:hypothetical protein